MQVKNNCHLITIYGIIYYNKQHLILPYRIQINIQTNLRGIMNKIIKYTVGVLLFIMAIGLIFCVKLANNIDSDMGNDTSASMDIIDSDDKLNLPIIMYHNIMDNKYKESKYEITVRSLEQDLIWLRNNGYTAVNSTMLYDYIDNGNLPNKVVMLTFDDGFYSYLKYLPSLMDKYDMRCIVGVVGAFTKFNKNTTATEKYKYLDYDDMAELAKCGRIEIANHTFDNHNIKNGAKGIAQRGDESTDEYRNRMGKDILSLENELAKYDLQMSCYVYPYGLYTKESENIIKSHNYRMSLTCAEKMNKISRQRKDLYLLGRFNRSSNRSCQDIITSNTK